MTYRPPLRDAHGRTLYQARCADELRRIDVQMTRRKRLRLAAHALHGLAIAAFFTGPLWMVGHSLWRWWFGGELFTAVTLAGVITAGCLWLAGDAAADKADLLESVVDEDTSSILRRRMAEGENSRRAGKHGQVRR